MVKTSFNLIEPLRRTTSVIYASPHSGRDYPWSFLRRSVLDRHAIRSSEDAYVDLLIADAPEFGAPLLSAVAPRAFIDLNRSPDELDPAVVEGAPRIGHNPRVSSGLGVIPRVVANGRSIYAGKISAQEARARIATHWQPYHDALRDLLDENRRIFGEAILVDFHSMPREALETSRRRGKPRPDVVLGDRFGASAKGDVADRIAEAFERAGFRVERNSPFAGVYIAQHYGRPSRQQHVVQVEIDRSLYMDEARIELRPDFDEIRAAFRTILADIADVGRGPARVAAE